MQPEATPKSILLRATDISVSAPANNGSESRPILRGVNLNLHHGDLIALAGPSGCGKSTLLKALARMVALDNGEISLQGTPATLISPDTWRRKVALVFQKPVLLNASVKDNLFLPWTLRSYKSEIHCKPSDEVIENALQTLGLLPDILNQPALELSGGEAARVALLRSALTQPLCMLLDEPSASLDENSVQRVYQFIRELARQGIAVLVVRHDKADIDFKRSYVMNAGSLEETL